MNKDLSKYVDPAKDEKFVKEYLAARAGIGHKGIPIDEGNRVTLRIHYNPVTGNTTTEHQRELVWEKDEGGYALSCDHYEDPDPDAELYISDESNPPWKLPPKTSEDDKKRKRKTSKNKKKNKKIHARKGNPSSPTTTSSKSIETLPEKNLDPVIDPSASTASGTKPEAEG